MGLETTPTILGHKSARTMTRTRLRRTRVPESQGRGAESTRCGTEPAGQRDRRARGFRHHHQLLRARDGDCVEIDIGDDWDRHPGRRARAHLRPVGHQGGRRGLGRARRGGSSSTATAGAWDPARPPAGRCSASGRPTRQAARRTRPRARSARWSACVSTEIVPSSVCSPSETIRYSMQRRRGRGWHRSSRGLRASTARCCTRRKRQRVSERPARPCPSDGGDPPSARKATPARRSRRPSRPASARRRAQRAPRAPGGCRRESPWPPRCGQPAADGTPSVRDIAGATAAEAAPRRPGPAGPARRASRRDPVPAGRYPDPEHPPRRRRTARF